MYRNVSRVLSTQSLVSFARSRRAILPFNSYRLPRKSISSLMGSTNNEVFPRALYKKYAAYVHSINPNRKCRYLFIF